MNTFLTRTDASVYLLVETELDAIMLDNVAGDIVGVIALGSSHAKPTDEAGVVVKQACRIVNALDYDTAGASAGRWWAENVTNSVRRPVPVGSDPGEFFEQCGGRLVREWIIKGLPTALQRTGCEAEKNQHKENKLVSTLGGRRFLQNTSGRSPLVGDHSKVLHLKNLLQSCPIVIKKTSSFYGLVTLEGFTKKQYWLEFSEISKLVFSEPVISYLHKLQDGIITANNITTNKIT